MDDQKLAKGLNERFSVRRENIRLKSLLSIYRRRICVLEERSEIMNSPSDEVLYKIEEIRRKCKEIEAQLLDKSTTPTEPLNGESHIDSQVKAGKTLPSTSQEFHMDTISILFVSADPTDVSRLRLGEEFREIQEKLKLAKLRDRFKLELPQLSVRPADIVQALLDVQPQIVHFSGHGSSTGALCFENQMGETQFVQPDALAALFEQFAHQVNCVL